MPRGQACYGDFTLRNVSGKLRFRCQLQLLCGELTSSGRSTQPAYTLSVKGARWGYRQECAGCRYSLVGSLRTDGGRAGGGSWRTPTPDWVSGCSGGQRRCTSGWPCFRFVCYYVVQPRQVALPLTEPLQNDALAQVERVASTRRSEDWLTDTPDVIRCCLHSTANDISIRWWQPSVTSHDRTSPTLRRCPARPEPLEDKDSTWYSAH